MPVTSDITPFASASPAPRPASADSPTHARHGQGLALESEQGDDVSSSAAQRAQQVTAPSPRSEGWASDWMGSVEADEEVLGGLRSRAVGRAGTGAVAEVAAISGYSLNSRIALERPPRA
jgi:hypothetical protein